MNIKELKKILDKTTGTHIGKIFIEFELSNKNKERKELEKFYDFFNFDYKCMELDVISWAKNDNDFNDTLTVKVFKLDYLKKIEEFYTVNRYFTKRKEK